MSAAPGKDSNVRMEIPLKGGQGLSKEDSIMGSIAALKNILMIETTGTQRRASISLQQTRYEERKGYEETIESLQTKVSELESDLERFRQESAQEKSVNKTLQNTNDALLKHKKEVMFQMELLKNRRGKLEDDLTTHIKSLRETKREAEETNTKNENQIKTLEAEKNAALATASDFENKYKESDKKVTELESNVDKLKIEIEDTNQRHKRECEDHTRSLQTSKDKLVQTEAKLKATENLLEEAQSRVRKFRNSEKSSNDVSTLIKLLQQAIAGPPPGSEEHASITCVKGVAVEICQGLGCISSAVKSSDNEKAQLVSSLKSSQADYIQSKQDIEAYEQKCRKLTDEVTFMVKDSLHRQSENKKSKTQLEQKCEQLEKELEALRAKERRADEQQEEVDLEQAESKRPITEVDDVDVDPESVKRQKGEEKEEEDGNGNGERNAIDTVADKESEEREKKAKEEEMEGGAVKNNGDDAVDVDEDHDSDGTEPLEEEEAEGAAGDDNEGDVNEVQNDVSQRQEEEADAEEVVGDDDDDEDNFIEALHEVERNDHGEVIDVDAGEEGEDGEDEEGKSEKDDDEAEDVVEVVDNDDDNNNSDDDAQQYITI